MAVTTIKVPAELRDRLSELARREHTTLAAVIAKLLDAAEAQAFWEAVREAHASMSAEDRTRSIPDATLTDGLTDPGDDALSAEDTW